MGLNELTIHELQDLIKKKEVTSTEISTDVFKRIDAVEERVCSFTTVMKEYALTLALMQRFASQGHGEFADRVLARMRQSFGGHAVTRHNSGG